MNFARDVVEAAPPGRRALVALARDGSRRGVDDGRARASAPRGSPPSSHARGIRRGDVVLTLLGNRPEWALTMLACFRQGYVVLPVHRAAARRATCACGSTSPQPALVVCDERNEEVLARRRLERADALVPVRTI